MTRLSNVKPRRRATAPETVLLLRRNISTKGSLEESEDLSYSRVQNRLENLQKQGQRQDRNLLKMLRQKRSQPSQLSIRLQFDRSRKRLWWSSALVSVLSLGLGGAGWGALFLTGQVTYRGVPYQVIHKFWQDKGARAAYFSGDRKALHYRLSALGVEQDIKNYYRDQFGNEYALDRYIHQIMFDRTGYIGEAYRVDKHGQLISKQAQEML